MRDGYGSQQAELTCSPCSRDVTAAIDWPCPPPPGKACWGRGMFASLAGTTDFVAVKVEFATGDGFSFPFGHFGVDQLAELTDLVGADREKVDA